jgi:hypothetical protein
VNSRILRPGLVAVVATVAVALVLTLRPASKGSFTLTLTDATTGTFTTTQKSRQAKLFSAEVITEAPWSGGVLPLADFGSVSFTNASFDGQPIIGFTNNQITMVTSSGATKATPSALKSTKSGSAFSVTWNGY